MHILLASKSPRRRELLAQLGLSYSIVTIDVEERLDSPVPAHQVAENLAKIKALGYTEMMKEDQVLVTADTVVVHGNNVLGKPRNCEEAHAMLRSISGRQHQVYTGVCLRNRDGIIQSFTECTDVKFRELSEDEIDYYIRKYQPYDKAGAYGIQEWIGMIGIEQIHGCFYNVMGLPLARLYRELQQFVDSNHPLVHELS
ncbi:MAG: Maf family protein [Bacteroidales bacterium]|nr:Maf family protein [Bacteroidales bacterium]